MQLRFKHACKFHYAMKPFPMLCDVAALHWPGSARIVDANVAEPPARDLGGIEQCRHHVRANLVGTADEALVRLVRRGAQQGIDAIRSRIPG